MKYGGQIQINKIENWKGGYIFKIILLLSDEKWVDLWDVVLLLIACKSVFGS